MFEWMEHPLVGIVLQWRNVYLLVPSVIVIWLGHLVYSVKIPPRHQNQIRLRFLVSWVVCLRTLLSLTLSWEKTVRLFRFVRNKYGKLQNPELYNIRATEHVFDDVPVRVYQPQEGSSQVGLVYFRGGGFIHGTQCNDDIVPEVVARLKMTMVGVKHRLAPEHPFPAPFDDCVTATKYFLKNAEQFEVDPGRIILAGDSSGGNFAAAVCLKLRDTGFLPQPRAQILWMPCLQAIDFQTPSYRECADHVILSAAEMTKYWLMYALGSFDVATFSDILLSNGHTPLSIKDRFSKTHLNHNTSSQYTTSCTQAFCKEDESLWSKLEPCFLNPYFSPLVADDVSGLPPALIVGVPYDVLSDDATWYAQRLKAAGNDVTYFLHERGTHVSIGLDMSDARDLWNVTDAFVKPLFE